MAYTLVTSHKRAITWDQGTPVTESLKSALLKQYYYSVNDNQFILQMWINDDPSFVMSTFLNHSKPGERSRYQNPYPVPNNSVHLQQYYIKLPRQCNQSGLRLRLVRLYDR